LARSRQAVTVHSFALALTTFRAQSSGDACRRRMAVAVPAIVAHGGVERAAERVTL
jgi:hypothetical protein